MNGRNELPARSLRPSSRRRWDIRHAWQTRGAGRHLYLRSARLRRFAGFGLIVTAVLVTLAVFA